MVPEKQSLSSQCDEAGGFLWWIAATAMQHGFVVITTDPHYEKVSQILIEFVPAE